MAALGRGRWLIRGARGRVRGCVGVVCAFPFWGRLGLDGPSEKKRRQSDGKQRVFLEGESEPVWQGKCGSVSGGRFGVCIQGSRQRRFSIGCSTAPPTTPFRFETSAVRLVASNLSAGGALLLCVSGRHSSLSLGRSQLQNLLWHFRLLAPRPGQPHAGMLDAGQAGTCRQGANLNNCGQR